MPCPSRTALAIDRNLPTERTRKWMRRDETDSQGDRMQASGVVVSCQQGAGGGVHVHVHVYGPCAGRDLPCMHVPSNGRAASPRRLLEGGGGDCKVEAAYLPI